MEEEMKQYYVSRVENICKELAVWKADSISGVDGQYLSDGFLTRKGLPKDFSPRNLPINCKDLGMDCSTFIFYHCDLGPGNIIVNPTEGLIGIIDWETAGFVPKEWIRTTFRISGGMDLPGGDQESRVDWRRRVNRELEREGFPDIVEQWMTWWKSRTNEDWFLFISRILRIGLRQKDLDHFKRLILHAYGYQHLLTFDAMEKMQLLHPRSANSLLLPNAIVGSAPAGAKTNYGSKALRLIVEEVNEHEPNDIAYVYTDTLPSACD